MVYNAERGYDGSILRQGRRELQRQVTNSHKIIRGNSTLCYLKIW